MLLILEMLLMTSAIPRPLSLYEKFTCKGRWEGENGQEVLCLFPTYGPLHSVTSHSCHLHFALASMQKMKHLRRRQVNDPPLPLIDTSWNVLPEGGGGFKGFERGKLLFFSQWLLVVYKLNFSHSCKNRFMIMRQGKGLCFQSSSTQVSANDLGASSL